MTEFTFSQNRIEHHVDQFGVTLRPAIVFREEPQRIQEFYNTVSGKYPELFDNLVQTRDQFIIQKVLPIGGGKGRLNWNTFVIHPQGAVFSFVRKHAGIDDEFTWGDDLHHRVIDSLASLLRYFPQHKPVRLGKVRELVYDCGTESAASIVREMFMKHLPDSCTETEVRWNEGDDDYNRKFQISSVETQTIIQRQQMGMMLPAEVQQRTGIAVRLDVNNRSMQEPLDSERLKIILDEADLVYENRLPEILNRDET